MCGARTLPGATRNARPTCCMYSRSPSSPSGRSSSTHLPRGLGRGLGFGLICPPTRSQPGALVLHPSIHPSIYPSTHPSIHLPSTPPALPPSLPLSNPPPLRLSVHRRQGALDARLIEALARDIDVTEHAHLPLVKVRQHAPAQGISLLRPRLGRRCWRWRWRRCTCRGKCRRKCRRRRSRQHTPPLVGRRGAVHVHRRHVRIA